MVKKKVLLRRWGKREGGRKLDERERGSGVERGKNIAEREIP